MEIYGRGLTLNVHQATADALNNCKQRLTKLCRLDLLQSIEPQINGFIYEQCLQLSEKIKELEIAEAEAKYKRYYGIK